MLRFEAEIDFLSATRHTPIAVSRHPKPSAKKETGEYETFEVALKKVLSVPHSEMKSKIDATKRKRTKTSASREAT
jgi:hypothetical protein